MEIKLKVKDKSVAGFLEEMLFGLVLKDRRDFPGEVSGYNLLRDEMQFKIDCGIGVGEFLKIELYDKTRNSNKQLVNTYIYEAVAYDDVAIKMNLHDFKVDVRLEVAGD